MPNSPPPHVRMLPGPLPAVLVLMLCLVAPVRAARAPRTDVLVLANGDHVTCEIKLLSRGQLTVRTDDMGTIVIKWEKVAALTATREFEVETAWGERVIGSLSPAVPTGLTVTGASATRTLQLLDVVGIRVVSERWVGALEGNLDVGASYTRGSGVAQLSVNFDATSRRPAYESTLDFNGVFTRTPEKAESTRTSIRYSYLRARGHRWMVGGFAEAQRNTDLGISVRALFGGGVGYRFLNTNRQVFITFGAAQGNRELATEGTLTTNAEALVGLTYGLFTQSFPKTAVDIDSRLMPSLSEGGRLRYELNSSVRRELWRDFSLAVTVYDSYDNRPPPGSTLQNDVGVTVSIGWKF